MKDTMVILIHSYNRSGHCHFCIKSIGRIYKNCPICVNYSGIWDGFFLKNPFLGIKGKYTNWNRICGMVWGRYLSDFNISIIDHLFYKQTLDLPAIFGIVLIMIDIIAINQFSKCLSH